VDFLKKVEKYYDADPGLEWGRLERHPLELHMTLRNLQRFLQPASRIADIGGGPGRYAIELTRRGHRVTLLDLSRQNIELARQKVAQAGVELEGFFQANALHLPPELESESFDAVLLLGPLYHLHAPQDRRQAVEQAMALLKPGGVFFASFITSTAPMVDMLKHDPAAISSFHHRLMDFYPEAVYDPQDESEGFTQAFFCHPAGVKPFMESLGLETQRVCAIESLGAQAEVQWNELSGELREKWMDVFDLVGADPTAWASTEHLLYVGKKPDGPLARFSGSICFFPARDLLATHHFYHDVLGLELFLDQGACRIYDVPGGGKLGFCDHVPSEGPKDPILTLLSPDVDAWASKLQQQGFPPLEPPRRNPKFHIYHFFVRDPDGYRVEIQKFVE